MATNQPASNEGTVNQPYPCTVGGCHHIAEGAAGLTRHFDSKHHSTFRHFMCPWPTCGFHNGHTRNVRRHAESIHGMTRPQDKGLLAKRNLKYGEFINSAYTLSEGAKPPMDYADFYVRAGLINPVQLGEKSNVSVVVVAESEEAEMVDVADESFEDDFEVISRSAIPDCPEGAPQPGRLDLDESPELAVAAPSPSAGTSLWALPPPNQEPQERKKVERLTPIAGVSPLPSTSVQGSSCTPPIVHPLQIVPSHSPEEAWTQRQLWDAMYRLAITGQPSLADDKDRRIALLERELQQAREANILMKARLEEQQRLLKESRDKYKSSVFMFKLICQILGLI